VKREAKNIFRRFYTITSLVLVTLFLSISVIEGLHAHAPVVQLESSDHEDIVFAADKCAICDYQQHKEDPVIPLLFAVNNFFPTTVNAKVNFTGSYAICAAAFTHFTNRGPPPLFS